MFRSGSRGVPSEASKARGRMPASTVPDGESGAAPSALARWAPPGTSVRESSAMIAAAGATLAGVAIALDRQERGLGELSAVQEVEQTVGVPVISIANLDALVAYLQTQGGREAELSAVREYRAQYGAR